MNRVFELMWRLKYRLLSKASVIAVEEYEDGIDAIILPLLAGSVAAASLYASLSLSNIAVQLVLAITSFALFPLALFSTIASVLWYFNPDPMGATA